MVKLLVISEICFLIRFFRVPLILTAAFLCLFLLLSFHPVVGAFRNLRPTRIGQCGTLQDLGQTAVSLTFCWSDCLSINLATQSTAPSRNITCISREVQYQKDFRKLESVQKRVTVEKELGEGMIYEEIK